MKYTWNEIEHHKGLEPHEMNSDYIFEVLLNVWNKYVVDSYQVSGFIPSTYFDEKTNNLSHKYVLNTIHAMLCELSDRNNLTLQQKRVYNYISSVWINCKGVLKDG